jgi:hypothetical protein
MNILIQQEKSPLVLLLPFPLWERGVPSIARDRVRGSFVLLELTPYPPRGLRPLGHPLPQGEREARVRLARREFTSAA